MIRYAPASGHWVGTGEGIEGERSGVPPHALGPAPRWPQAGGRANIRARFGVLL